MDKVSAGERSELWKAFDIRVTPTLVLENKAAKQTQMLPGLQPEAALDTAFERLRTATALAGEPNSLDYAKEVDLTIDLSWEYPGLNGTLTVPKNEIKEVRKLQSLDNAMRRRIEEEKSRLKEDLSRQDEERRAKAAREAAEVAVDKGPEAPANEGKDSIEQAKKLQAGLELLKKFPPGTWGPDRVKQIRDKMLVRLPLTLEEREFLENFELWILAKNHKEQNK